MTRNVRSAVLVALALGTTACGDSGDSDDGNGGDSGSGGATGGSGGSDMPTSGSGGSRAGTGGSDSIAGSGGTAPGGGTGGTDPGGGTGGTPEPPPPPSTFSCDELEPEPADVTERSCFDFADGSTSGWTPDGGEWAIGDGAYVGTGPAEAVTCPETGSLITASLFPDINAVDVRVHAHITGLERADKVLVLRGRDSGNRIELNFRAFHEDEGVIYGGDLVVQELVDCVLTMHVPIDTILVPHELRESLEVDVELRGQALKVWVGGTSVFDDEVPVASEPGSVGVGVITSAMTRFDDLVVEVLE